MKLNDPERAQETLRKVISRCRVRPPRSGPSACWAREATEDWSRLGGIVIAVLALGAALAVLRPRACSGAAAGPEAEIITALKEAEHDGLSLPVPGAAVPLVSRSIHFARITVSVAPGGRSAPRPAPRWTSRRAGPHRGQHRWGGADALRRYADGDWRPEGPLAPRLLAVVTALEARRRALEAGTRRRWRRLVAQGGAGGAGRAVERRVAARLGCARGATG